MPAHQRLESPARALRPSSKFPPGPLESFMPSQGAPPFFPSPTMWHGLAQGGPYREPSSTTGRASGPAWHLWRPGGMGKMEAAEARDPLLGSLQGLEPEILDGAADSSWYQ